MQSISTSVLLAVKGVELLSSIDSVKNPSSLVKELKNPLKLSLKLCAEFKEASFIGSKEYSLKFYLRCEEVFKFYSCR